MKSTGEDFCRNALASQALRVGGFISPSPASYPKKFNSHAKERHLAPMRQRIIDHIQDVIAAPKPCVAARHNWSYTLSHSPMNLSGVVWGRPHNQQNTSQAPLSPSGSPHVRLGIHCNTAFLDGQFVIASPVEARVYNRPCLNSNIDEADETPQDAWLPPLSPQPDLTKMIRNHIAHPSRDI